MMQKELQEKININKALDFMIDGYCKLTKETTHQEEVTNYYLSDGVHTKLINVEIYEFLELKK